MKGVGLGALLCSSSISQRFWPSALEARMPECPKMHISCRSRQQTKSSADARNSRILPCRCCVQIPGMAALSISRELICAVVSVYLHCKVLKQLDGSLGRHGSTVLTLCAVCTPRITSRKISLPTRSCTFSNVSGILSPSLSTCTNI